MLKRERLTQIEQMVDENGIMNVTDMASVLAVSDMTIRRDLDELEKDGKLVRIHGGAQALNYNQPDEIEPERYIDKSEQKKEIARYAAGLIKNQDVIFLGSGTTIEILARFIDNKDVLVVTNSYPVFEILSKKMPERVILAGGLLHVKSGAFVGAITNSILKSMKFSASFVSCSALHEKDLMIPKMEEGEMQKTALLNSRNNYLLVDSDKFNTEDFYVFSSLNDINLIISDSTLPDEVQQKYAQYADIVKADKLQTPAAPVK